MAGLDNRDDDLEGVVIAILRGLSRALQHSQMQEIRDQLSHAKSALRKVGKDEAAKRIQEIERMTDF